MSCVLGGYMIELYRLIIRLYLYWICWCICWINIDSNLIKIGVFMLWLRWIIIVCVFILSLKGSNLGIIYKDK